MTQLKLNKLSDAELLDLLDAQLALLLSEGLQPITSFSVHLLRKPRDENEMAISVEREKLGATPFFKLTTRSARVHVIAQWILRKERARPTMRVETQRATSIRAPLRDELSDLCAFFPHAKPTSLRLLTGAPASDRGEEPWGVVDVGVRLEEPLGFLIDAWLSRDMPGQNDYALLAANVSTQAKALAEELGIPLLTR